MYPTSGRLLYYYILMTCLLPYYFRPMLRRRNFHRPQHRLYDFAVIFSFTSFMLIIIHQPIVLIYHILYFRFLHCYPPIPFAHQLFGGYGPFGGFGMLLFFSYFLSLLFPSFLLVNNVWVRDLHPRRLQVAVVVYVYFSYC